MLGKDWILDHGEQKWGSIKEKIVGIDFCFVLFCFLPGILIYWNGERNFCNLRKTLLKTQWPQHGYFSGRNLFNMLKSDSFASCLKIAWYRKTAFHLSCAYIYTRMFIYIIFFLPQLKACTETLFPGSSASCVHQRGRIQTKQGKLNIP